jgi:hypothetical protein
MILKGNGKGIASVALMPCALVQPKEAKTIVMRINPITTQNALQTNSLVFIPHPSLSLLGLIDTSSSIQNTSKGYD